MSDTVLKFRFVKLYGVSVAATPSLETDTTGTRVISRVDTCANFSNSILSRFLRQFSRGECT